MSTGYLPLDQAEVYDREESVPRHFSTTRFRLTADPSAALSSYGMTHRRNYEYGASRMELRPVVPETLDGVAYLGLVPDSVR